MKGICKTFSKSCSHFSDRTFCILSVALGCKNQHSFFGPLNGFTKYSVYTKRNNITPLFKNFQPSDQSFDSFLEKWLHHSN